MEDTTINPSAHVADDGGELALRLVSERFALVKTVRNGDWLRLLSNLRGGRPSQHFRTSFTLLPHDGLIHLFGQADAQKAGLLFDRRALDTSSALCWPSGYFAKTEHHMHVAADTGASPSARESQSGPVPVRAPGAPRSAARAESLRGCV